MPRRFRSPALPVAVVAVLLVCGTVDAGRLALIPGDDAPPMRGYTIDGDRVIVRFEPGTVTLLNFWATWCVPCRDEMPALQKLHESRAADGMQIIGIHVGYVTDEDLRTFFEQIEVDYTVIRPDVRWLTEWGGVSAMPITFLVDGEGKLVRRYLGATEEQIAGLVYDAEAALEGRELGPMIIPETPAVATEEDRPKPPARR